MLWYVLESTSTSTSLLFFFWSQSQSGSSFGYLSNRIGVSNHFCFYVIPRWLIINLVETIRTAAISTVMNGNFDSVYPPGSGDSKPSTNLNVPQMLYSIPELNKTYWVRTNEYWVFVTRSRQEAVWVLFCSSHVRRMPLTGKWCVIVGCLRVLKWNTSCTFGEEDFIIMQVTNQNIINGLFIKDYDD